MPVSGHEETEVKTCAGQFNGLIAGVPIKKRRFPLIHYFSSLSGEQYSLTEETESLRKDSSAPLVSTPTLSNAAITDAPIKKRRFPLIQASSSSLEEPSLAEENNASHKEDSSTSLASTLPASSDGIFVAPENPRFEERKPSSDLTNASFVQSKFSYLRPKLEEPDLATRSSTLDIVDNKEKSITSESYEEKLGKKSELLLATEQSLALKIGAEISKQNVQDKCKQESHAVLESTNLSLGFKQNLFPALASLNVDNSFQKTEKSESFEGNWAQFPTSFSLKLSLSKEDGSSKSHNGDAKGNRANWDLNTRLDAWKEPGRDATTGKTSIHGLLITDNAIMEKHVMFSTGVEPNESTSLKQTSVENQNEAFANLSRMYGQEHKYVDPCNIFLASCLSKYTGESSRSVKQNPDYAIPTLNSSNVQASSGDVNIARIRTVKSELLDENQKHDLKEAKPSSVGSLDGVSMKRELVEHSNVDSVKPSEDSNMKFHNPKFIKSEPGHENNQERPKTTEYISADQISRGLLQGSDNCPFLEKPVTSELVPISTRSAPPVRAICSVELSTSVGIVSHLENHASIEGACVDEKASQVDCPGDKQVSPETVSIAMVGNAKPNGLGKKDSVTNEENTDDAEGCRLKLKNEVPSDPRGRGEDGASDDDKITLSTDMLEYDSYGYDYESDDMDIEQYDEDDYEDGEVLEPVKHSVAEDSICEVREVGGVVSSNYDSKQIKKEVISVDCPASHLEENDNRNVNYDEINCVNDGIDTESMDNSDNVTDKNMCLQESWEAEKPIAGSQIRLLDLSERQKVCNATETELSSDQGNNERNEVDAAQCADDVVKNLDIVRETDSEMSKMEVSVNIDDANKDASNGGNQGRIINLSRAASSLSPTKSRSIPSRGLPSQDGRDVLSEKFHHDKLHGQSDDFYIDGPCRFSRERYQDISPRNSRLNFVHGRGRINSRIDARGGEWESDRQFSGEFYDGPRQFRGARRKFASSAHNADPEYNDVTHDGCFAGTSRLGRKPLNNEGRVGRHITLRRRSPGERENMQMGHRIPRTMSPSRCVGDDCSDFANMRHGQKYMRGYHQEPLDPMFTHPQPFERVGGRFTRGASNFIQRRGPQRICSRSPIRSRSRSPGLWSSPQRRSPRRLPNGFVGHPELTQRRPLYRDDRMRSPDCPVFHGGRMIRRHVSPSYMSRPSNEMRDFGYRRGCGRGCPRSFIPNRSPSDRIMFRKRFDAVDPQDRADNDDYFEGPMQSGRLLELNGEGNGDERRRFNERRGPVRSFRPPYNAENFHLDAEDGPRPYRFCTEDSELQERSSVRERDFDMRIENRPANMPTRRTRNIDEQEANYRDSGQVWSDDGFDDISRMKRERDFNLHN